MEKILVSACLLGDNTRYDGKPRPNEKVLALRDYFEFVPFCPEVEAGLGVPRSPAEIRNNSVINKDGQDLTKKYIESAEKAVNICRYLGIRIAILKDGSPACGCRTIYDGTFTSTKIDGLGVTARYLISAGVKVYADTDAIESLVPAEARLGKKADGKKTNRYVDNPKAHKKKAAHQKADKPSQKRHGYRKGYRAKRRPGQDAKKK